MVQHYINISHRQESKYCCSVAVKKPKPKKFLRFLPNFAKYPSHPETLNTDYKPG
jgi:hypothetical protein